MVLPATSPQDVIDDVQTPEVFTEWVVLSAMSNGQMAGVRNEAASSVVRPGKV
jgi:hypothetical protein